MNLLMLLMRKAIMKSHNYDAITLNHEDGLVDLLLTNVLTNEDYQVDISIMMILS
ncbi:MAG: hypothetical protein ACJAS9_003574 [Polaribacter sp.]|jgi:hypothetical protein